MSRKFGSASSDNCTVQLQPHMIGILGMHGVGRDTPPDLESDIQRRLQGTGVNTQSATYEEVQVDFTRAQVLTMLATIAQKAIRDLDVSFVAVCCENYQDIIARLTAAL